MLVKHTDTFYPTYWWLDYSCLFPMHWLSLASCQPGSIASIMAKSIWQQLVWHSSPTAMGYSNAQCNRLAPYPIQHLPGNCLSWHFDHPRCHSSLANVLCPKCFQLHCPHHFRLDDTWFFLFSTYWILQVVFQGGPLQTKVVAKVIFQTIQMQPHHHMQDWTRCLDHLFRIWNISDVFHLLVFSARLVLCSM
jgi:hypothetical protein